MMHETVSSAAMICMAISCLIGFAIPIALGFYFALRKHADVLPFFVGCIVFVLFALVLERILHSIVLDSSAGAAIQGSTWLSALYGGLAAGVFEETGRYLAIRFALRRYRGKDVNALMYGAGHGGIEAALLLGLTMISNLALAAVINTGRTELVTAQLSGSDLTQIQASFAALAQTPAWTFLLGAAERISAVILQMALSVLVWFSVKRGRVLLFVLAIVLHAAVDGASVVLASRISSYVLLEALILVMSLLAAGAARIVWKYEKKET